MKRKKAPESGGSWMDTYGDMVTLLLCFFVLLYSISSVNEQKFNAIAGALNPDLLKEAEKTGGADAKTDGENPNNSDKQSEEVQKNDATIEELYEQLQQAVHDLNIESETELSKGEGYTFISFKDKIFFDGDQSVLKPEGKKVLDEFAKAIKKVSSKIQEIQILGHTSQGNPDVPNNTRTDRTLSSLRAMEVTVYLQEKDVVSPEKLVSVSYGQFRPIATFETAEGRAQNRRVEVLITEEDAEPHKLQDYYDEMYKQNKNTEQAKDTKENNTKTEKNAKAEKVEEK